MMWRRVVRRVWSLGTALGSMGLARAKRTCMERYAPRGALLWPGLSWA